MSASKANALLFKRLRPLSWVFVLSLAGCTAIGTDYQRPVASLPAQFSLAVDTGGEVSEQPLEAVVETAWWKLFQDQTLVTLVERALHENAEVRLAVARMAEAEALARGSAAAFFPEIDAQANLSRSRLSTQTADAIPVTAAHRTARGAALTTAYEIDVWGKVQRSNEAAKAEVLASQYAQAVVQLSVASMVSQGYLNLRALDAQLLVTNESLQSRKDSLALVKTRVLHGLVSPLDQHQAEEALAQTQAQQAELRRQRALALHQLALLTATPDLHINEGDLRQLPMPLVPPAGLPSALVQARPDIWQAEAQLMAAHASLGVAKAGYFPKFTLTGSLGSESATLSHLFSSGAGAWSLAMGALMPVLDFGRTAAKVDQAHALRQQALINYQNTLQTAFKEVNDALINLRETANAEEAQTRRVDAAKKALKLAQVRYQAGYSGYLDVLDAQRTHNEALIAYLTTRQARLTAAVALFKALGAGWKAK